MLELKPPILWDAAIDRECLRQKERPGHSNPYFLMGLEGFIFTRCANEAEALNFKFMASGSRLWSYEHRIRSVNHGLCTDIQHARPVALYGSLINEQMGIDAWLEETLRRGEC